MMMRIHRMTLVLPARFGGAAQHEARRIAEAAAERLGQQSVGHVRIEVAGNGLSGHALAGAVGRAVATKSGGGR